MKIYENSGVHLWLLMWKAFRAVEAYDRASISRSGFKCLSDFAVLEVLLHKGPMPVNAIGEKVMLTSGSITTAVQRLEKQGLLRRERGQEDGRVVLVHLTGAGRERIEAAFAAHSANLETLFEVLDPEERSQFAQLMRTVGNRAAQG